jgi:hypothetical protein
MEQTTAEDYYLRILRNKPWMTNQSASFYLVPPCNDISIENNLLLLERLKTEQLISFFDYIEERECLLIGTDSGITCSCFKAGLDESGRANAPRGPWPRACFRGVEMPRRYR